MISIHALREEGDAPSSFALAVSFSFLSTPSARRATRRALHSGTALQISIHALREEGDQRRRQTEHGRKISIHALREEGDLPFGEQLGDDVVISIHALREEGD